MIGNKAFFIFSAELASNTDSSNMAFSNRARAEFGAAIARETIGVYTYEDGTIGREVSFVVGAKHENQVLDFARTYGQESVLFVDEKSNAYLVYLKDNKTVKLGKFQSFNSSKSLENFTFCPETETYWSID